MSMEKITNFPIKLLRKLGIPLPNGYFLFVIDIVFYAAVLAIFWVIWRLFRR